MTEVKTITPQPVETLSKYAVMASVMLPIWFTFKSSAFAACNRCCKASQDPMESSLLYFLRQSDHPVPTFWSLFGNTSK